MKSLLLLEPDVASTIPLKNRLKKSFPSLRLDHFQAPREAFKMFCAVRHPVVILELVEGDELDGLELVQKIVTEQANTAIFVTSDFPQLDGLAEVFRAYPNIQCFKKPYKLEKIVEAVTQRLGVIPDSVITGLTPTNVLLMIHMERKNAFLEFVSDKGPTYCCFSKGRLFHAAQGSATGAEALLSMLHSNVTEIRVYEGTYNAETNVDAPLSELLTTFRMTSQPQAASMSA